MIPPERKIVVENRTAAAAVAVLQQAHAGEQEGDHDGGEDLEEALDPEVDHPPPPVLGDRQVGVPVPHQAGDVEQRDRRRGEQEQPQQVPVRVRLPEGRPHRPGHHRQPEEQADRQEELPEPAEVDVLVTLVAEPEVGHVAQPLLDREPLAGHRADDDDQQADEQEVDAQPLELRLVARDGRRHEQPGGQPGAGDPEDGDLRVPGPGHAVGQPLGQRDAVEARSLDPVMRRHRPEADLGDDQRHHDPEILQRRPHRRRGIQRQQRVLRRQLVVVVLAALLDGEVPAPGRRCRPAAARS